MKIISLLLILCSSFPSFAWELERGQYEQPVEEIKGSHICDYNVIVSKNENAIYLTTPNCAPGLSSFKLSTINGKDFEGRRIGDGGFDLKVEVDLITKQDFKIKFYEENRYTGETRNFKKGIVSKKTYCY